MAPTVKKTPPKAPTKNNGPTTKSHAPAHPSWIEMIKECILVNTDARGGVSRPMIKKFVEAKYHIEVNHTTAAQLNRAISSGTENGILHLPKGPSGKVKIAPRGRTDAAKENAKPVGKKPVTTIKRGRTRGRTTRTKATAPKRPVGRPTNRSRGTTTKPAAATTTSKQTPKRSTATTSKTTSPKTTTRKTTTARRDATKRTVTGQSKRPTRQAKARLTRSRAAKGTTTSKKPAPKP